MANLFFIHTPFQLFVAQQLIHQESLKNNIMIYGYIGNNSHILDLYDIMIIEDMWCRRFFMSRINDWNIFQLKHPYESIKFTIKNRKWLNSIIKDYCVDNIFFGDINNTCYQLLMIYYKKKRVKINVFEEGSSHYFNSKQASLYGNQFVRFLKTIANNILFYIPLWSSCFAYHLYIKHIEYDQLIIDSRYNICPYNNEPYDKALKPTSLLSEKVKSILNDELKNLDTNNAILFLSEPLDEYSPLKSTLEILTLKKVLTEMSISNQHQIIVKFHPREDKDKRKEILSVFDELNYPYYVICSEFNIPIEYFLQQVNFKQVITYFCSTVFYNGYLYKKTEIVSLLPTYYEYCVQYKSNFTIEVENYLNSNYYKQLYNNV